MGVMIPRYVYEKRITLAGAAAPATTWNGSDKASGITLSGDLLTATGDLTNQHLAVRSTISHSTGKWRAKFTVAIFAGGTPTTHVGLINAVHPIDPGYIGQGNAPAAGVGYGHDGVVRGSNGTFGGATLATLATYSNGDVIEMRWNADASTIFFKVNSGNWNNNGSADPETNTLGIDIAAFAGLGPFFAACSLKNANAGQGTGDSCTADFNPSGTSIYSGF